MTPRIFPHASNCFNYAVDAPRSCDCHVAEIEALRKSSTLADNAASGMMALGIEQDTKLTTLRDQLRIAQEALRLECGAHDITAKKCVRLIDEGIAKDAALQTKERECGEMVVVLKSVARLRASIRTWALNNRIPGWQTEDDLFEAIENAIAKAEGR